MALGVFEKRITYIPSFKRIGGVATAISDIDYDNAILFADIKEGIPKIRPNPGNGSHIMIIECWESYGSTVYVAQSGSSKNGVDYDRIYEITQTPKSSSPGEAYWKIRQKGGSKDITCVITKRIQTYAAGD